MGQWDTNTRSFKVNIRQRLIGKLKSKGCKFCLLESNPEVNKKKDSSKDSSKDWYKNITVTTIDNEEITGDIVHIVTDNAFGTNISNWFIICPGK